MGLEVWAHSVDCSWKHGIEEETQAAWKHTGLFGQEFQIVVLDTQGGESGRFRGTVDSFTHVECPEESHIGPE